MIIHMKLSADEVGTVHGCLISLQDNEHDKSCDEGMAVAWSEMLQKKLMEQKEGGVFELDEHDIAVMSYACDTWCVADEELDDAEDSQQKATGRAVFERLKAVTVTVPDA